MARLGFYHLTRTSPEAALPELLGRTLAAGERAVVRCGGPARVAALDRLLWEVARPDWLPHGTARRPHPEWQPVWLTEAEDNPNQARYLFLLDGRTADPAGWERVFDLFDGTDPAAVAAARRRWSEAREAGHALTYWKQSDRGWVRG